MWFVTPVDQRSRFVHIAEETWSPDGDPDIEGITRCGRLMDGDWVGSCQAAPPLARRPDGLCVVCAEEAGMITRLRPL